VGRSVRIAAPAKLNLALAVVGKRADGFHDLRSVFARLDLADDVRVAPHRTLEVRNTIDIGPGEDLAARAVRVLAHETAREPRAFIRIRKRIPLAAGLGGGSSDAAAVMRALATLWGVDVDLVSVGAQVGSDVPFFAANVAVALVSGRGEVVAPLRAPPDPFHVVVLRPPVRLRTADVFAALQPKEIGNFGHVEALAQAFRDSTVTPETLRAHADNALLAAAERRCEAIASWRAAAAARGIALALTGSGPTLFAVADDRGDALRIARILRRAGLRGHAQVVAA
jgi:4-diphosphocytidyl-2-C-methyl-D-erythritol kinase